MAQRTSNPQIGQPSISQQQAVEILSTLLHDFEAFSEEPYAQAKPEEREWQATTESMVIRAFGENSVQHRNYQNARRAGNSSFTMATFGHGPSDAQKAAESQKNFEKRTSSTRAAMKAMIRELQILAPKAEFSGVYDSGDPFSFYRDLTQLLRTATSRVFIVDAYFGREIFDLYLEAIPTSVAISILTAIRPPASSLSAGILTVAKLSRLIGRISRFASIRYCMIE
jgi:hypothetical protein